MKCWFLDKRDHDLQTHSKRLKDLRGNFDRMEKEISSEIYVVLTFSFIVVADFLPIETRQEERISRANCDCNP